MRKQASSLRLQGVSLQSQWQRLQTSGLESRHHGWLPVQDRCLMLTEATAGLSVAEANPHVVRAWQMWMQSSRQGPAFVTITSTSQGGSPAE